jgi:hypothetical protein
VYVEDLTFGKYAKLKIYIFFTLQKCKTALLKKCSFLETHLSMRGTKFLGELSISLYLVVNEVRGSTHLT